MEEMENTGRGEKKQNRYKSQSVQTVTQESTKNEKFNWCLDLFLHKFYTTVV